MNAEEALAGNWSQVRLALEAHVDNPTECAKWCLRVGLFKDRSTCWRHRCTTQLIEREPGNLVWWCAKCRERRPVREGSIFEDSKLPLGKLVMLAFCFADCETYVKTRRACNFRADEEQLSQPTISNWFDTFREQIINRADEQLAGGAKIGGPDVVVQIDEAVIGRRKYNRGRILRNTWVVGMIDESGAVRLEACETRDRATLHRLIRKHVEPGSILHTDGWRAYQGIETHGYQHRVVIHGDEFVAEDGTHTQRIESQWRAIRRRFSKGGIRHEDIGHHLVEYLWRRDCLRTNEDAFASIIKALRP